MAALSIQVPYPVFYDRDGQPLNDGNIYIGVANLDPVTNPLPVYYDEDLTIAASQPLVTSGGYVYRNGTPAQLYVDAADFSITVNDSKNLFVYSFPSGTGIGVGAASVEYDPPFPGAVTSGYTVADKLSQILSMQDFGAVGDGVADDRNALLAAIDAAFDLGGADIYSAPGSVYAYSGRIKLRPGVRIMFGRDQQTLASGLGIEGTQLVALDSTGGIDLVGGSHICATLRTAQATSYTGPMLDINDTKSTELGFGRTERQATFDVDIRGNRQVGSVGVRFYSDGSGGVSWVQGNVSCGEMDYPLTFETTATGYTNENWVELLGYGAVEFVRGINGGSEISANRIKFTAQTDSLPRAKRVLRWDGTRNMFELNVFDWSSSKVDASDGGTQIELTSLSGGNILEGIVNRSSGSGGFVQNPVLDFGSPTTNRNIINLSSGRFREQTLVESAAPRGISNAFFGNQDDFLSYATERYTVSVGGTTPPDATSQYRLFSPESAGLVVSSATDFTVTVDTGISGISCIGMGVFFVAGRTPDRVRVEVSPDGTTWTTILQAGYNNDQCPIHLSRDDSFSSTARYFKLTCENDTADIIQITRWWAAQNSAAFIDGALAPIHNPYFWGSVYISSGTQGNGLYIAGNRVVRARENAVADATGAGDIVLRFNELLTRLRNHGLIAP